MTDTVRDNSVDDMYWQVLRAVGVTAASTGLVLIAGVALATLGIFLTRAHQWGIVSAALLLMVIGTWGAFESVVALHDVRRIRTTWERVVLQYALVVMTAANVTFVLATLVAVAGLLAAISGLHAPLL